VARDIRVVVLGSFPPPFHGQAVATDVLHGLLEEAGVPVERIEDKTQGGGGDNLTAEKGWMGRAWTLFFLIGGLFQLRRSLHRLRPTHIVYTGLSATIGGHVRNLLTYLLALPKGVPVYAVVHNGDIGRLAHLRLTKASWKWLLRRTRCLVTLSNRLSAKVRTDDVEVRVIPNTLDHIFDSGPVRRRNGPSETLELLFLGNLLPEKGVEQALRATEVLARRSEPARLRLVGAPPTEADLRPVLTRSANLGRDKVEYLGVIRDRNTLKELLSEVDVLLLPTRYRHEAFPMVLLEAMACGTPVISTPIGGIADMVESGESGFLVDPPTPDALVQAVTILRNHETWMKFSRSASKRYLERFSRRVVARQWLDLLSLDSSGR
jgi:glycosyltransferase involved in cell wall biosynthesis